MSVSMEHLFRRNTSHQISHGHSSRFENLRWLGILFACGIWILLWFAPVASGESFEALSLFLDPDISLKNVTKIISWLNKTRDFGSRAVNLALIWHILSSAPPPLSIAHLTNYEINYAPYVPTSLLCRYLLIYQYFQVKLQREKRATTTRLLLPETPCSAL